MSDSTTFDQLLKLLYESRRRSAVNNIVFEVHCQTQQHMAPVQNLSAKAYVALSMSGEKAGVSSHLSGELLAPERGKHSVHERNVALKVGTSFALHKAAISEAMSAVTQTSSQTSLAEQSRVAP